MDNSSLYRFLSFESFVDIIQSKSIKLVQPKLWEDPYEGYLLKAIKSNDGRQKIKQILEEIYNNNEKKVNFIFMIINSLMNNYYGQCWTTNSESDALWRIYSYDKQSIRIEIDRDSISKLEGVHAYDVEYTIDEINLREELGSVISRYEKFGGLSLEKAFLRKRKAFEHESEVRLLKSNENSDNIPDNKSTISSDEVYKDLQESIGNDNVNVRKLIPCPPKVSCIQIDDSIEFNNGDNVKPCIAVDYSHINNFIKSVMLHPLAPDWFDSTLRQYCKINNLNYLGKSTLYEFKIR